MSIKMLREHLCADWNRWQAEWPSDITSAVEVLVAMIDPHRPLASNGKHGNLHTATCGCEDKPGGAVSEAKTGHGFTPGSGPFADPAHCEVMLSRYRCPYKREEHPADMPPEDIDCFGYCRTARGTS